MNSNPTTKFFLNCGFWVAIVILTFTLTRGHFVRAHAQSPGAIVPYTVTLSQEHVDANGAVRSGMTITWAIRSDGSRANRIVMSTEKPLIERMISFTSGKHMTIMELTKRKSTTFDPSITGTPWLRDAAQNCVLPGGGQPERFVGIETIDGYRAARVEKGNANLWFALDYGCPTIKEHFDWDAGDKNDTRLVKLIPGEPSPDLFSDPADYEELPPSGLYGATTPQTSKGDAYYNSHRPH